MTCARTAWLATRDSPVIPQSAAPHCSGPLMTGGAPPPVHWQPSWSISWSAITLVMLQQLPSLSLPPQSLHWTSCPIPYLLQQILSQLQVIVGIDGYRDGEGCARCYNQHSLNGCSFAHSSGPVLGEWCPSRRRSRPPRSGGSSGRLWPTTACWHRLRPAADHGACCLQHGQHCQLAQQGPTCHTAHTEGAGLQHNHGCGAMQSSPVLGSAPLWWWGGRWPLSELLAAHCSRCLAAAPGPGWAPPPAAGAARR